MDQNTQEQRKKVIEVLNLARARELMAISQYMNQHFNLDDMDYREFASSVKKIAIVEMRHAETFAERIKELDGEPTTEPASKAEKGQKVQSIFSFDAKLEDDTMIAYNQYRSVCRENSDSISMKIFEKIIDEEQGHFNYFDKVNDHITNLGDVYLAQTAGKSPE